MKKKKILFIYKAKNIDSYNGEINSGWVEDCKDIYDIQFWGKGFTNTSLQSLKNKIDNFKPDFVYLTMRKRYAWLHDLTNMKVPKIFVEVDTWAYNSNDDWYKQFDKVYCREQQWIVRDDSIRLLKTKGFNSRFGKNIKKIILKNCSTWENIPLFRWSVPDIAFPTKEEIKTNKREGIKFIGNYQKSTYVVRKKISEIFKDHIWFGKITGKNYWDNLKKSSALLCPTESNFGDFIPAKLFEFLASGAAVITNCQVERHGMDELNDFLIKYIDLDDLKQKLDIDFTLYHNKAIEIMRNHTHKIRYKELFG